MDSFFFIKVKLLDSYIHHIGNLLLAAICYFVIVLKAFSLQDEMRKKDIAVCSNDDCFLEPIYY